jgi:hypothetical protein
MTLVIARPALLTYNFSLHLICLRSNRSNSPKSESLPSHKHHFGTTMEHRSQEEYPPQFDGAPPPSNGQVKQG